jgi:hypothetical protein
MTGSSWFAEPKSGRTPQSSGIVPLCSVTGPVVVRASVCTGES